MKKLLALLLAAVMVLGLMAGCNGTTNNDTKSTEGSQSADGTEGTTGGNQAENLANAERYGGHLDVLMASTINNTDPHKQTNVWRYLWTNCVYENALSRDADHNIQPGICDYELSDDKLTLKLWVREGKVFHNGDPVEIEDVKASLDRACGGLFNSGKLYIANLLESSTIEGDVLTLKFKEYNEKTMYYMASYQTWLGVLPQEICEKYGQAMISNVEDAIGTGPYRVTDYTQDILVTVERFDDYVVMDEDKTGQAGPKYAYMDSISFHYFSDYSSAAVAVMSGQYDVIDDIDDEVYDAAAAVGINVSHHESNTGCSMIFNTYGDVVCAKYPSLRKAIMAAIDYEEYLEFRYGRGGYEMNGNFVLGEEFQTDVFNNADYYGPQNLEVAAKYIEQAKAEGWDGEEPVLLVFASGGGIDEVLIPKYLKDADIPYTLQTLENTARSEIVVNPKGAWDLKISYPGLTFTPVATTVDFLDTNYNSDAKKALIDEMNDLIFMSDEYMAKWDELSKLMVDECIAVNMGFVVWSWYHPETLNINDDGIARYFYNAYWSDPENHPD